MGDFIDSLNRALDPADLFGVRSQAAAEEASELQASASLAGVQETARQFDLTREDLRPQIEAGNVALQSQLALLGLSGDEAQQTAFRGLEESPGQRFLRQRQERALLRNASATGGLGGGNVLTALQEQSVGFAQQDIQNQFGRLGQIAGQGQAGVVQTGQFGAAATSEGNRLRQAGAEARASGILGAQQAQAQTTENVAGVGLGILAAFSDRRLKSDIVKVGDDEFGNLYRFKYAGGDAEYIGRMAQELMEFRPAAVYMHESGYLQVSEEFAPEEIKWH